MHAKTTCLSYTESTENARKEERITAEN